MNLLLFFPEDYIDKDIVRISSRRFLHIKNILKSKENDLLNVGLLNGNMGEGKIIKIAKNYADIKVNLTTPPPKPLNVKLILSLMRPIVLKRLLLTITTLGIKEIYLINSNRVEKSFFKSNLLKEKNLLEPLYLGLEQAKDTILPKVYIEPLFKPFVEDKLPEIIKNTTALIAHPDNSTPANKTIKPPITLAIGPEGGFIDYEVDKLRSLGFIPISLGPRILKVETAAVSLISAIS